MAKDRILDGSSRGSERQAGSLSYIAPGRLCGGGGDTFHWRPLSRHGLSFQKPTYNCLPACLGPKGGTTAFSTRNNSRKKEALKMLVILEALKAGGGCGAYG
jgi:hypothetical protein